MSLPEEHAEVVGPAKTPRQLTVTISFDRSALPSVGTAFGVALVSATIVMSAIYSRKSGDLDTSNYVMGVLGTIGLLGIAVGALLTEPDAEKRATLVSWPGAAGIVGVGAMLSVAINHSPASAYVFGGVVAALSVAAYLVTRAAPFTLTSIAGAAVLYIQAFSDTIGAGNNNNYSGDSTGHPFIRIGAAILVFVAVATLVGWLLPKTRVLTGVVVGAGGVFAMVSLFEFLSFTSSFATSFASSSSSFNGTDTMGNTFTPAIEYHNPYTTDIWLMLGYCAALALFWLACAAATGHVGFRILAIVMTVLAVPATTIALSARHPTWWEVVTCAIGGVALVVVALRSSTPAAPVQPEASSGTAQ